MASAAVLKSLLMCNMDVHIFGSCCGYHADVYDEGLFCSYFEHLQTLMKYFIDKVDPVLSCRNAVPDLPLPRKYFYCNSMVEMPQEKKKTTQAAPNVQ